MSRRRNCGWRWTPTMSASRASAIRVWYVACTRARELLIVPQQSAAAQNSWARVIDLACAELPVLDLSKLDPVGFSPPAEAPNLQTAEIFAAEGAAIAAAAKPMTWLTPSNQDQ